jgi:hypothetical protein
MTQAIPLTDFADAFAAKVNSLDVPDIHPAGAVTVAHWLGAMRAAAENGRHGLVAEFARMVADKIALERAWENENQQTVEDHLRHVG